MAQTSNQKPQEAEQQLRKAAGPLLKFINENYNPHVTVIVTPTSVEILEGVVSIPEITDYLVD